MDGRRREAKIASRVLENQPLSDCPALPVLTPEKAALLRALVQERLATRRAWKLAAPDPAPRYDEVFFVGTAWLDRRSYDDSFEDLGQDR